MTPESDPAPGDHELSDHLERANAQITDDAGEAEIRDAIGTMVSHPQYPCLGDRLVFKRGNAAIEVLDSATDEACLARLAEKLRIFGSQPRDRRDFGSLVAVFHAPHSQTEASFEDVLWGVLQHLQDADYAPWTRSFSDQPGASEFSFSLASARCFGVGLHPAESRIARRAPLLTLVFNLNQQFEQLRDVGGFTRMPSQVLAVSGRGKDLPAREVGRRPARHSQVAAGQRFRAECGVEAGRRPHDRVALGHRHVLSAGGGSDVALVLCFCFT